MPTGANTKCGGNNSRSSVDDLMFSSGFNARKVLGRYCKRASAKNNINQREELASAGIALVDKTSILVASCISSMIPQIIKNLLFSWEKNKVARL